MAEETIAEKGKSCQEEKPGLDPGSPALALTALGLTAPARARPTARAGGPVLHDRWSPDPVPCDSGPIPTFSPLGAYAPDRPYSGNGPPVPATSLGILLGPPHVNGLLPPAQHAKLVSGAQTIFCLTLRLKWG